LPPLAVVECPSPPKRLAIAEAYVAAIGAEVRYGGDAAMFAPASDFVACPPLERFVDAATFYGPLLHEHIQWTHHEKRLARTFGKQFGDSAYCTSRSGPDRGPTSCSSYVRSIASQYCTNM